MPSPPWPTGNANGFPKLILPNLGTVSTPAVANILRQIILWGNNFVQQTPTPTQILTATSSTGLKWTTSSSSTYTPPNAQLSLSFPTQTALQTALTNTCIWQTSLTTGPTITLGATKTLVHIHHTGIYATMFKCAIAYHGVTGTPATTIVLFALRPIITLWPGPITSYTQTIIPFLKKKNEGTSTLITVIQRFISTSTFHFRWTGTFLSTTHGTIRGTTSSWATIRRLS